MRSIRILAFNLLLLFCGFTCVMCGLIFGHSVRANIAGSSIKYFVMNPIYERVREIAPDEAVLIEEDKPRSGNYTFGLSAGSPQYAAVTGQQNYSVPLDLNTVLLIYEDVFTEAGWIPGVLSHEIAAVFQHPHHANLLAGICRPMAESDILNYRIFFDFREVPSSEGCRDHRCLVAGRYC